MKSREAKELIISWVTISIAFSYFGSNFLDLGDFLYIFPISLVAVGTGFIFHELAHRAVAKRYGCLAEFRMWSTGLLLALVLPIISAGTLFFAAPGAVYIYGPHITRKENAMISLAGPLINIIVGALFFIIYMIMQPAVIAPYLLRLLERVAVLNLWFAFFNLIPVPPLDGSKIMLYNPTIWAILFFPLFIIFAL
jgi:Zn-dependent protease